MSRFEIADLPLKGLKRINRQLIGDNRGFLARLFCAEELGQAGFCEPVSQINHTYTQKKGAVRGMHYQLPPFGEIKLVSCIRGAVFDVAVDLRSGSSTFLEWYGTELTADNHCAMLIPEGFAHGFQALTSDVELLYVHSAPYVPGAEAGLRSDDPRLSVKWPLPIAEISMRDAGHPLLDKNFSGLTI